jgi:hypothetical protein
MQLTKIKSCSHDMLNNLNNFNSSLNIQNISSNNQKTLELENKNDKMTKAESLLLFKDRKQQEFLSPRLQPIPQLSPTSSSSVCSSLSSSLARLCETRSNTTNYSSSNKTTTGEDTLLTVESLFRDLMLDCDESIRKLDEIENLKKVYKLKQEAILKTIEVKNLLSIYYINKGKLKVDRSKWKRNDGNRRKKLFKTYIDRKKINLNENYLKKLLQKNVELKLNGKLLTFKKIDKIKILNRLFYRFKFIDFNFNILSLCINSYYLNYSLLINLKNFKFYSKNNRKIIKKIVEANKKNDEKLINPETIISCHRSLLDEYYDKYCAITANGSSFKSQSLKCKKRSRTEERVNEFARNRVNILIFVTLF